MKVVKFVTLAILLSNCAHRSNNETNTEATQAPLDSATVSYNDLWAAVKADTYHGAWPEETVTPLTLDASLANAPLTHDAQRTIQSDKNMILPAFKKRLHPIGVCMAGNWEITADTPYSGYFKKGAKGYIIARASSALGGSKRGDYRAFGIAGKIFTDNSTPMRPAHFFAIDDLAGTKIASILDTVMTSQPKTTLRANGNLLAVGGLAAISLSKADSHPGMRQLYEVAELGNTNSEVKAPTWLQLRALTKQRTNAEDFRTEMLVNKYEDHKLVFAIEVTDDKDELYTEKAKQIGTITFTDSTVSKGCDQQLHFHHPKFDQKFPH